MEQQAEASTLGMWVFLVTEIMFFGGLFMAYLVYRHASPTGWLRRYRVRVHGMVEPARLTALARGITIDGIAYGPIRAQLDRQQGSNAWITLSLQEGKNREVRRVLEHLGYPVTRLIRLAYGPFQLGHLARGAIEEVTGKVLREQLGKDGQVPRASRRN